MELEMLTEECEELINKLSVCVGINTFADEPSEQEEHMNEETKREKERLEKDYVELCIEIERQQKELDNYKFKIKVSNKEAEYYSRQIKEKEEILANLEKHQTSQQASQGSLKKRTGKK